MANDVPLLMVPKGALYTHENGWKPRHHVILYTGRSARDWALSGGADVSKKEDYTKLMADPGTCSRLFGGKTGEPLLRAVSYTMSSNTSIGGAASRGYPGYFGDAGLVLSKTRSFDPQSNQYFSDPRVFFLPVDDPLVEDD